MPRPRFRRAEVALFIAPLAVLLGMLVLIRLKSLAPHRGASKPQGFSIDTISFSPDGKTFATGDTYGAIGWWDARTGKRRLSLQKQGGWCLRATWSPNSRFFAATSGNTLLIYNGRTGGLLHTIVGPLANFGTLAVSPDSRTVAVGAGSNSAFQGGAMICLFDLATGRRVGTLSGAFSLVGALDFSPDGKSLISYNGATRSRPGSGNSSLLYLVQTVQMWDVPKRRMVWEKDAQNFGAVRFSPDGSRVALGCAQPSVFDAGSGSLLTKMQVSGEGAWYLSYQSRGRILAAASNGYHQPLTFWDADSGEAAVPPRGIGETLGSDADAFAFSPDEKRLVYVDGSNDVQMWDTSALDLSRVVEEPGQLLAPKRLWKLDPLRGVSK